MSCDLPALFGLFVSAEAVDHGSMSLFSVLLSALLLGPELGMEKENRNCIFKLFLIHCQNSFCTVSSRGVGLCCQSCMLVDLSI